MALPSRRLRSPSLSALKRLLQPIAAFLLFALALGILRHELRQYGYHEIVAAAHAVRILPIASALMFAALSYASLVGYDWVALQYARRDLPPHKVAFASFTAYALSQNLGFTLLTGGSIRGRLYSAWGLSTIEIAAVMAFNSITFALGFFVVGSVVFLLEPTRIAALMPIAAWTARLLGLACLAIVAAYLWACSRMRDPLHVARWSITLPTPRIALLQLSVGTLDWLMAGAVLFVLLPSNPLLSYGAFLSVFMVSQAIALLTPIPGGVGVFETVALLYLKHVFAPLHVIAGLVLYRLIYYVLPLLLASVLLALREMRAQRAALSVAGRVARRSVSLLVPNALAALILLGGAVLLISGATPAVPERLRFLDEFLPLGILEASHFLGSIVGTSLLILSWAVARRLDAAYHLAVWLLLAGIALSLLKGLDYEEAMILTLVLGVLVASRHEFDRRASLLAEALSPGWVFAALSVLFGATWLGFFAYKHVGYSNELWWQFALHGNAPRFLRATAGALGAGFTFGMLRLLKPAIAAPAAPSETDMDAARRIMSSSPLTYPSLALLGDKALLFNDARTAFIMYAVAGRSWIAMGDPVAADGEAHDLAWSFRELVDEYAGFPVFYEASPRYLPLYIDLGLTVMKLGEEARVPLETFSLHGRAHGGIRRILRTLEQQGGAFEIVPAERLAPLLPELRRVSDDWLDAKHTREKRFSLGMFDEAYLLNFPAALVRLHGEIVGFANIWAGAAKHEISVDLMRHSRDAPRGIMDYLFTNLLLWSREQGYQWFNLGMAPLTGLHNRPLAPRWHRLGTWIYRHGEHFYNFQGLRQYKEKFDPVWEARYLVCPGGLALPRVLASLTAVISGGMTGAIAR